MTSQEGIVHVGTFFKRRLGAMDEATLDALNVLLADDAGSCTRAECESLYRLIRFSFVTGRASLVERLRKHFPRAKVYTLEAVSYLGDFTKIETRVAFEDIADPDTLDAIVAVVGLLIPSWLVPVLVVAAQDAQSSVQQGTSAGTEDDAFKQNATNVLAESGLFDDPEILSLLVEVLTQLRAALAMCKRDHYWTPEIQ